MLDKFASPKKVLIVDDDAFIRRVLRVMLESGGNFSIFEAGSGLEALQIAGDLHPDIILMDIMMPGLTGLEACYRLKQNVATSQIPIIIISALTSHDWIEAGRLAGASLFLTKPVAKTKLLGVIDEIFCNKNKFSIEKAV